MKRLVADTGPVLHLHEAGALHLLPLIGETSLPPLVAAESRSRISALPPKWAKVQALSSTAEQRALEWRRAGLLHGGELFGLPEEIGRAVDDERDRLPVEQQLPAVPARVPRGSEPGPPPPGAEDIAKQSVFLSKPAAVQ